MRNKSSRSHPPTQLPTLKNVLLSHSFNSVGLRSQQYKTVLRDFFHSFITPCLIHRSGLCGNYDGVPANDLGVVTNPNNSSQVYSLFGEPRNAFFVMELTLCSISSRQPKCKLVSVRSLWTILRRCQQSHLYTM